MNLIYHDILNLTQLQQFNNRPPFSSMANESYHNKYNVNCLLVFQWLTMTLAWQL